MSLLGRMYCKLGEKLRYKERYSVFFSVGVPSPTFSELDSFFDTSGWMHSCSREPMIATLGLQEDGMWNLSKILSEGLNAVLVRAGRACGPVSRVLELVDDLRQLWMCPWGIDYPGNVSRTTWIWTNKQTNKINKQNKQANKQEIKIKCK